MHPDQAPTILVPGPEGTLELENRVELKGDLDQRVHTRAVVVTVCPVLVAVKKRQWEEDHQMANDRHQVLLFRRIDGNVALKSAIHVEDMTAIGRLNNTKRMMETFDVSSPNKKTSKQPVQQFQRNNENKFSTVMNCGNRPTLIMTGWALKGSRAAVSPIQLAPNLDLLKQLVAPQDSMVLVPS